MSEVDIQNLVVVFAGFCVAILKKLTENDIHLNIEFGKE